MCRKINLVSATLTLITILLVCALANAQPQSKPKPTPAPTSRKYGESTFGTHHVGAKVWNGKVQRGVLVTALVISFDNPNDYDNFAAGKLPLNLLLKNTLSGQTIRLDSSLLKQSFRPAIDKKSITVNVVIDNLSAPLSEAACGEVEVSAEDAAYSRGVNLNLTYSPCSRASVPQTAADIRLRTEGMKGIGGGAFAALLRDPRIMTREAVVSLTREAGTIVIRSSQGSGSAKSPGF
jgi:hypothetical protein